MNVNLWKSIDLSLILHALPQLSPVLAAEFPLFFLVLIKYFHAQSADGFGTFGSWLSNTED